MSGTSDSRATRQRIDAVARCVFLQAVRGGAKLPEAAAKAGFSVHGFYGARRRDPVLKLAWAWAMELSAVDERRREAAERAGEAGPGARIAANNKRRVQLRRKRRVVFTEERQEIFLCHLARTADFTAAAEAAGVHESTVYKHRQRHPEFAAYIQEALDHAFVRLEAEALRQRLEAQQRLKENMAAAAALPAETALEFERVLKLLWRWDRRNGRPGMRGPAPGRMKSWTFEQAIEALDRKLRAVDIPIVGEEPDAANDDDRPEAAE